MRVLIPLLILFAVGGCGPLVFQTETKEEAARQKAKLLDEARKAHERKTESDELRELEELSPYLEHGEADLVDPWGSKYQFKTVEVEDGRMRVVFWTTNPDTGKPLGWPQELAEER